MLNKKFLPKKFKSSIKYDLSQFGYDISHLNKEDIDYYSKNPGYFQNLMMEKNALEKSKPLIKNISSQDSAALKNSKLGCIRLIYSCLTIESSFDKSEIPLQRFKSDIWNSCISDIILTFNINTIMRDDFNEEEIIQILSECIDLWCGGEIIQINNNFQIKDNGHFLWK